ncbi:hypothetical protein [Helicobacter cetorum]|uniref:Uncharacterized protein n=2 Tax=Helicobacter cetorum TaxID=138563 RepID=I0EPJ2_HELC0|nr:hypothetical protein [Helicobacter cetorum]AFI04861.1 hypothetical protein HCW_08020 [Helicobacter cetorum MIT 00-7128]
MYWYKEERKDLLSNVSIVEVNDTLEFIPKIGSPLEKNILQKISDNNQKSLLDLLKKDKNKANLFLSSRATFWIKCFRKNKESNEYAHYYTNEPDFIFCLFNSSLFFWYWSVVSDGWHITNKELKYFTINKIEFTPIFKNLANELERKLEKTKKFIGTKQTQYEYKHKECKKIIDKIDDNLANIYKLNDKEISYIKNFAYNYRMSKGAVCNH